MRDLLSLDPKIHGLRTDTKEARRFANRERVLRVTRAAALEHSAAGGTFVADRCIVFGVNVHGVLLRGRRRCQLDSMSVVHV
jgi:hypothetical protein